MQELYPTTNKESSAMETLTLPLSSAPEMKNNDVVWEVIGDDNCCFMDKMKHRKSCSSKHNVKAKCRSKYATIIYRNGMFLYIKTIGRAHKAKKLWDKVQLPKKHNEALKKIDEYLKDCPEVIVQQVKRLLTKLTWRLVRSRKLRLGKREIIGTCPNNRNKRGLMGKEKAETGPDSEEPVDLEALKASLRKCAWENRSYHLTLIL